VEVVPQAIYDARENAARNGIRNAEFFVGKAEDVLREYYQSDSCKNRCIDSERTLAAGDEEKAETRGVLKDKETIGPGGCDCGRPTSKGL
jgi:23S rRNA (uracil1939-C5)-methyltransferase